MKFKWNWASGKDQKLPTGSIIHWGERAPGPNRNHRFGVTCGRCGKKRFVCIRHSPTWTGFCIPCVKKRAQDSELWKGGRTLRNGYVFLLISALDKKKRDMAELIRGDPRYVAEHRLVAALEQGRPLKKGDVVHHLNEVKTDNRPSNLVITNKKNHHSAHSSILKAARSEVHRLQKILDASGIPY